MRIALGFSTTVGEFARQNDAATYRDWGGHEPDEWRVQLIKIASREDTEILWDLTEVDVTRGLQRAAAAIGGPTDWELLQFKEHPEWLTRTTWYLDGAVTRCPELLR